MYLIYNTGNCFNIPSLVVLVGFNNQPNWKTILLKIGNLPNRGEWKYTKSLKPRPVVSFTTLQKTTHRFPPKKKSRRKNHHKHNLYPKWRRIFFATITFCFHFVFHSLFPGWAWAFMASTRLVHLFQDPGGFDSVGFSSAVKRRLETNSNGEIIWNHLIDRGSHQKIGQTI